MGKFECCFCRRYTTNASKINGICQTCFDGKPNLRKYLASRA